MYGKVLMNKVLMNLETIKRGAVARSHESGHDEQALVRENEASGERTG